MHKIGLICVLFTLCTKETLGLSEEIQELMDNLHKTCVSETGAAEDMIINARKGDFAEDDNFKCYFKCLFEEMGCLTEDGKVDIDAVVAMLPPDVAEAMAPVIEKCKNEGGTNPCERAFLLNKCFQNANPDLYLLP